MDDEPKKIDFEETLTMVSSLLIGTPNALTIKLGKDITGKHYYTFADQSKEAKKARKEARKLLSELYQSGAYNFAQFAEKLRVETLDIQALLDDGWREEHNID